MKNAGKLEKKFNKSLDQCFPWGWNMLLKERAVTNTQRLPINSEISGIFILITFYQYHFNLRKAECLFWFDESGYKTHQTNLIRYFLKSLFEVKEQIFVIFQGTLWYSLLVSDIKIFWKFYLIFLLLRSDFWKENFKKFLGEIWTLV